MKKSFAVVGILVALSLFAAPVFAQQYGPGPRHGMMNGPGYGPPWQDTDLTKEQSSELYKLRQSFIDETASTRADLWSKRGQLYALMSSSTPDEQKVMALVDEINKIKSDLNKKRVEFLLKAKKVSPEAGSYGFGGPMMGEGGGHMGWGGGPMMRGWGNGCPGWGGGGPYAEPENPQN